MNSYGEPGTRKEESKVSYPSWEKSEGGVSCFLASLICVHIFHQSRQFTVHAFNYSLFYGIMIVTGSDSVRPPVSLLTMQRKTRDPEGRLTWLKVGLVAPGISDILAHLSQDPAERAFAGARDKFLWDQEVREGRAREKGRDEGIEIDVIKTAKAMIEAGFDIETVCKATGLNKTDLIS